MPANTVSRLPTVVSLPVPTLTLAAKVAADRVPPVMVAVPSVRLVPVTVVPVIAAALAPPITVPSIVPPSMLAVVTVPRSEMVEPLKL